jgi:hypothetical protein
MDWIERAASRRLLVAGLALVLVLAAAVAVAARAEDRHVDYYYPSITSQEDYSARAAVLSEATRELRVEFITNLTQQMLAQPYHPEFIIFAKGERAEKMIIVGLNEGGPLSTLYRARATLAMLTAIARGSQLFQEFGVQDFFTFFDLARLFGFERITVSDGRSYAHQIDLH